MSQLPATAVILFIVLLGCTYASGMILFAMTGKVNRKLPDEEQINYLLMYPGKVGKVKSQYRRLYPNGRLALLWNVSVGVSLALFLAVLWSMGFFR